MFFKVLFVMCIIATNNFLECENVDNNAIKFDKF